MKQFILLVDTAPRSGKQTIFIAKAMEGIKLVQDHAVESTEDVPAYEIFAKCSYVEEARERVRELNSR